MIKPFEYIAPTRLDAALAGLREYGPRARVLAGGTDLLLELRRPGAGNPTAVVDVTRITELQGITRSDGSITLGPLVTHAELCASEVLRARALLLSVAASTLGSPQIRNRGTVGGNLVNAAPCADTVPPLIALEARVTLSSADNTREVPLSEFFVEPYRTIIQPDEILTAIRFPTLPRGASSCYLKLGRRNAVAIARLSVAAVLVHDKEGVISDARIVPGSAFPTWQRVSEAENLLIGEKPSSALFFSVGRRVSELMVSATGRRWSSEYKEPVVAALVRRALETCAVGAV